MATKQKSDEPTEGEALDARDPISIKPTSGDPIAPESALPDEQNDAPADVGPARYRVAVSALGRWPKGSEVTADDVGGDERVAVLLARGSLAPIDPEQAMPVSLTLANALSRVRAVTGDTDEPPIFRGGDIRYKAIIAEAASEHAAAQRACQLLAAQIVHDPDSLSAGGKALAWRERVPYLLKVASGEIGTGLDGDPALTAAAAGGVRVGRMTAGDSAAKRLR